MWPTMGGIPLGVLQYIGISTRIQFYIMLLLIGLVGVSILSVFEYRFNVLFIKPGNIWSLIRRPWLFLHYLTAFLYMAPLFYDLGNQKERLQIAYQKVPCTTKLAPDAASFIVSVEVLYPVLAAFLFTVQLCAEVFFFFIYIYYRIFKQLTNKIMSKKTFTLQKRLLIALFIQVMIPLNLFVFPIAYSGYATVWEYYNQGFNNLALVIGSTHGTCSTVTMILIHTPYRNVLWSWAAVKPATVSNSVVKI